MIDASDVGDSFLYGGLFMGIIFLVWYLAFSVPEIDECHKNNGVIVRIEGEDKCILATSLKEVTK